MSKEIMTSYNNEESILARKEQEDPWVLYLIVRSGLEMSAGKIAAQCGHAVGMIYEICEQGLMNEDELIRFHMWKRDSFRKVVLKCSDKKWNKIKDAHVHVLVRDAGLTEVPPESETVIGLLPIRKSDRKNCIKKLQVLK